MTGEFETSRDRRILAAFLIPVVEHVARSKDSSRGNDGFDHVRAIEACLIVCGAVRESKRLHLVILLSTEDGTPSRATEIAIGVMSVMSRRVWRSPVMQTFDPPSINVPAVSVTQRILTEETSSLVTPQTCGEHTTCVTLSRIDGIVMSCAMADSSSWS